jgi:hypothetical protein
MKMTDFEKNKKYERDGEDHGYLYVDDLEEIHLEYFDRPLNLDDLDARDWVEVK